MTVQVADAYKTIGKLYSNEIGYAKLTYDFALDGGAFADTHRLALVDSKILIIRAVFMVETACTSEGSATLTLGAETADADAFGAAVAVATLVDDYAIDTTAGNSLVVDAADYITANILTADLTAGKVHLHIQYVNAV